MLIDITLEITPSMLDEAIANANKALTGHVGTHFDVMDKKFPLDYTERKGIVFDVSHVEGRDVELSDIDIDSVEKDSFVVFYTGYSEREAYGSKVYFSEHPQLSDKLIDTLLDKEVSMIGLDFAGIRRGKEHIPKDQQCADKNVFIIENLCNLKDLLNKSPIIHTFPMKCTGITGLPCRVIAEI